MDQQSLFIGRDKRVLAEKNRLDKQVPPNAQSPEEWACKWPRSAVGRYCQVWRSRCLFNEIKWPHTDLRGATRSKYTGDCQPVTLTGFLTSGFARAAPSFVFF